MRCEYKDGFKVDYSGPLHIEKGEDVNISIKEELIPDDIKSDLDMALYRNRCGEMRKIAEDIIHSYGYLKKDPYEQI